MSRVVYWTATTLDGFLADEHDSLDWLLEQPHEPDAAGGYDEHLARTGALVMGATTYAWVVDHLAATGEPWPYAVPCWVFTHRDLAPVRDDVHLVQGAVADHREAILASAQGRDVWVVGGGDLAGQCADLGWLDQVVVSIAPVTLGAGRPLLPRRLDLRLVEHGRNGAFVTATYDVVGPL